MIIEELLKNVPNMSMYLEIVLRIKKKLMLVSEIRCCCVSDVVVCQ